MKLLVCVLGFLYLMMPTLSEGQGTIVSLFPNSGYPGQEVEVLVRGFGTDFRTVYGIDFGSNISVRSIRQVNAEMLYADIIIGKDATTGPHDVNVRSASGITSLPGGFSVFQQGSEIRATLNIIPIQQFNIDQLGLNHSIEPPIFFNVGLYNDMAEHDVEIVVKIAGANYGELAAFSKKLKAAPGQVEQFSNRDFDLVLLSGANSGLNQAQLKMGSFPADDYTYYLSVYVDNAEVYSTQAQNLVLNPTQRPSLITPGNNFYTPAAYYFEKQPLFQWYSQGDDYDFYLYRLEPGQSTPEEVVLNRPIYSATGLKQLNLLYPASAYLLKEGETYAWRIVTHYEQGNSSISLPSEVYWFRLKSDNKPEATVSQLELDQDRINLEPGGKYSFKAHVFNAQHEELSIKPSWRVVPTEAGTVDENGNFTAGPSAQPAAVIAEVNGKQEYILVNIIAPKKPTLPSNAQSDLH